METLEQAAQGSAVTVPECSNKVWMCHLRMWFRGEYWVLLG